MVLSLLQSIKTCTTKPLSAVFILLCKGIVAGDHNE